MDHEKGDWEHEVKRDKALDAKWENPGKVYLGDSVYAELSCGMVKLTTNNGLGDTNIIYLEPEVLQSLERFVAKVRSL